MPRLVALLLITLAVCLSATASEPLKLPEVPEAKRDWQATGELAGLLTEMQTARETTQRVFEPLSIEEMNWRPLNGTHTPRWNAEHMMGRQLLYFSQIYAAQDPERHEALDLNPAQMPPDYQAAHPDWTGADEAAWIERVGEYIQGHAYLLEGLDLDAKAPGSRWVLRKLLIQMDRHYREHTANVVKKFALPDWPQP